MHLSFSNILVTFLFCGCSLQQYDHDSSTVRKRIFQEALVDITLPAIRRNLAPAHKPDLQKLDQYIFADYTNFIKVENVYEDILLNILTIEVDKVVKEAASLRKNNLMVDSTDLQSASQSSLTDSRTPPLSAPASPAKMAVSGLSRQAERASSPLVQNLSSSAGRLEVEGGPVVPDMAALTPPVIVITPQNPDPAPLSLPAPAHILTYTADVSVAEPDTPSPLPDTPSPLPDTPSPLPEMSSAESDYPSGAASTKPDASLVNHDAPLATITPYAASPQPPLPVAEPAPQTPEVTDTAKASQPPGTEDKPDTDKARNSPVSDSVLVCVEALSAVSMILPEATVLSTDQRQRQATDRAVYLKTPAGVKEGASVPLTVDEKEEEEEHLCKEAEAHHIGTAPSNAHIETVDSDLVHSDTPREMKASGTVQTSSSTQARDTEPACPTQNDPNSTEPASQTQNDPNPTKPASQTQIDLNPTGSEMQPGGSEDRAAVTSVTRVTVTESEGALLACNTLVTSRGVEAGDRGEALGGVVEAGDRGEALGGGSGGRDRGEALGV
ncbi:unnamed protein product, partial [Oncorhynchus mykiss]